MALGDSYMCVFQHDCLWKALKDGYKTHNLRRHSYKNNAFLFLSPFYILFFCYFSNDAPFPFFFFLPPISHSLFLISKKYPSKNYPFFFMYL